MIMKLDYQTATEKHKALSELGLDRLYLAEGEYPWSLVTDCQFGPWLHSNMPVTIDFTAYDPVTGLTFLWSVDFEYQPAQDSSYFQFNTERCEYVLARLNGEAKVKFQNLLLKYGQRVKKQAEEMKALADHQLEMANTLIALGEQVE